MALGTTNRNAGGWNLQKHVMYNAQCRKMLLASGVDSKLEPGGQGVAFSKERLRV